MVIRLLVIGALLALLAAFMGRRRLAIGLMAALAIAAAGLWSYERYQAGREGELFAPGEVKVSDLELTRASYRPNLFELTGRVRNESKQAYLDGVALVLSLQDCRASDDCRRLPDRREFVEVKLPPGEASRFLEKIYFEKSAMPQGRLRIEHRIASVRGHRPVW